MPPEVAQDPSFSVFCDSPSTNLPLVESPFTGKGAVQSSLPFPDPTTLSSCTVSKSEFPPKKSHARRQPPGHIPRPRNGFILFRCDFVKQKKIPESVEGNHRNISRIAGILWRQMSKDQRRPWMDMAEVEKKMHEKKFPGYRYQPTLNRNAVESDRRGREKGKEPFKERTKFRRARNRSFIATGEDREFHSPVANPAPLPTHNPPSASGFPRRTSSCPPSGAVPIQNSNTNVHATSDDTQVSRRPSRVTFYQSVSLSQFPFPSSNDGPPTYWNLPMHHVMPTCPPGWVTNLSSSERWTEWSEDVETEFNRHALLRNLDYDNSFRNGVPQWTNGLFQSHPPRQDESTPVFTNPFHFSESYQNAKPEEISPLETGSPASETQNQSGCLVSQPSESTAPFYDHGCLYSYAAQRLEPLQLEAEEHLGRLSLEDQPRVFTTRTSEEEWDSRPIPMISTSRRKLI
ncbi:hypothetical protein E1B28_010500 [Marasmius oreades]|uniref:HMG box domain-containing protein n=1 Tax=Marasmius oreades TaxID=181124 RepID=A0A9P7RXD5_9AGAR|nr:uncharacterized protein E1B28_010500 [Marasmius oreades]KAG7091469.1 hypothetical protein E1B28_010500 [Marasmius oreades]